MIQNSSSEPPSDTNALVGVNDDRPYLVVLGHIAEAETYTDPPRLQTALNNEFRAIHDASNTLAVPFSLTGLGTFQAVYQSADGVFADLLRIAAAVSPLRVCLALGVGGLTSVGNGQPDTLFGPAPDAARQGLADLTRSGCRMTVRTVGLPPDSTWSALFALLDGTVALVGRHTVGWHANRWRIFARLLHGERPPAVAAYLGITPRAVYKNVQAGHLTDLAAALNAVEQTLDRYFFRPPGAAT